MSSLLATCAVALYLVAPSTLWAQGTSSSYFMVQGPLGSGGAYQTYKFRVEYTGQLTIPGYQPTPPGTPVPLVNTGEALIAAIFGNGVATASGIYSNSVGTMSPSYGIPYSFQMAGGPEVIPGSYPDGPQWGYFAAGGTYSNFYVDPPDINITLASGVWTQSPVGLSTRYLTNGSFDAYTFGALTPTGEEDAWGFPIYDFASPVGVQPTLADFSGVEMLVSASGLPYNVYLIVPEPSRALFLVLGIGLVIVRRSRGRLV
ncbi:PEP-CTERM sorting domain-containing protein [Roseimicrobium sp. ORNL1]|uniref:PEP-CTERM sorting domain-containing protein n=1 Tax=Roseimicrobium sp. ORNL1 TaxID=2711231 RepID=UPI00197D00FC|nr:PEP-CTERM sorting domain-containing protein [Roseimicrobium sp. ORNL1]